MGTATAAAAAETTAATLQQQQQQQLHQHRSSNINCLLLTCRLCHANQELRPSQRQTAKARRSLGRYKKCIWHLRIYVLDGEREKSEKGGLRGDSEENSGVRHAKWWITRRGRASVFDEERQREIRQKGCGNTAESKGKEWVHMVHREKYITQFKMNFLKLKT